MPMLKGCSTAKLTASVFILSLNLDSKQVGSAVVQLVETAD